MSRQFEVNKVVALAGGVGGAKFVDGLARCLHPGQLTVIVNTGDDFEWFGLKVSPDLDTVCYTLAGLANPETGWGRDDETWHAMGSVSELGGPTWFRLGDRDLGTHLERTRRLTSGEPLSAITRAFCDAWNVPIQVLPMSDDPIATVVISDQGELPFQDYFVRLGSQPRVKGFRFSGVDQGRPAPGVISALECADLVVICPSNPWVSIDPILAVPGVRSKLADQSVVAISPIIGGRAVKGPAARMYSDMGHQPSAANVARHYQQFLRGIVIDKVDDSDFGVIQELGIHTLLTHTLMKNVDDRRRLAEEVLNFGIQLRSEH